MVGDHGVPGTVERFLAAVRYEASGAADVKARDEYGWSDVGSYLWLARPILGRRLFDDAADGGAL